MSHDTFLRRNVETALCEHFVAAGALCSLRTNCEKVLEAARTTFFPANSPEAPVDFSLRFWADDGDRTEPPWPKPYARSLGHLVFVGFDLKSSLLANLRTRHVIGRFSAGMAADHAHFTSVIFPMLLTIVGPSVGIAELHCACVARSYEGVLLAGPSGAGKSTLSLALSQNGFGFISDDRTFCSSRNSEVEAWGLPTLIKLRSDAGSWFEELRRTALLASQRDKPELWLEPEKFSGVERIRRCRPTSVVFLERRNTSKFSLSPISSTEARHRLTRELAAEWPPAIEKREPTLKKIVELPCWLLQYGGRPEWVAQRISDHLARS